MGWLANDDPHGCTIKVVDLNESFSSWNDNQRIPLRLISQGRIIIATPPVQSKYVELPGKNGKVDMTEVLTGFPIYGNRTGTLAFILDNTNPSSNRDYDSQTWAKRYENIMSIFHGRRVEMTLDDDPDYSYKGRISIDSFTQGTSWSQITMSYDFDPYKYEKHGEYHVEIENTGSSMDIVVKKGSTTIDSTTTSDPYDLNPYLDIMPVIADSTIEKSTTSNTTIAMVNDRLNFNKSVDISASGTTSNYYGMQSFVMCSQLYAGAQSQNKCSIKVSGANSTVKLNWTNGRL